MKDQGTDFENKTNIHNILIDNLDESINIYHFHFLIRYIYKSNY